MDDLAELAADVFGVGGGDRLRQLFAGHPVDAHGVACLFVGEVYPVLHEVAGLCLPSAGGCA